MVSDSKNKTVQNDADVSCWNCFTVENAEKDIEPVPLSKIRKENREKLKLYSFLASELSKPKAVSLKQKVSENYTVSKRLEENLKSRQIVTNPDIDIDINVSEEKATIIHKVQIETSTPKSKHGISGTNLPQTVNITFSENDLDYKESLNSVSDIAYPKKDESPAHKTICNGNDSSYTGSSNSTVRDLFKTKAQKDYAARTKKKLFKRETSPQVDRSQSLPRNDLDDKETLKSVNDITYTNKDASTVHKTISNGFDSGYTGSSNSPVRELFRAKAQKVIIESNNAAKTKKNIFKTDTSPQLDHSQSWPRIDLENKETLKSVNDIAQHNKAVTTADNTSFNGSDTGCTGSSITVRKFNQTKAHKDSAAKTEKTEFKRDSSPELDHSQSLPRNDLEDKQTLNSVNDIAPHNKDASTADNTSSNGSDSGFTGSSMTVGEIHETEAQKDSATKPEETEFKLDSSPELDHSQSLPRNLKPSLSTLHLSKSSTLTTSTKSLFSDTSRRPVKTLRWSTLCMDKEDVSHSEDDTFVTETLSPGHATLPRRSNSPLPHERDMLDRDRFPMNRSGLSARSESMASVYSGAGEGTRSNVTVRGEVQFSLLYNYRLGALEVGVKRCRDLAPVDTKRNRSDPYVKVYLLPDKSKAGKRKTKVKKNTLNPVFEETLSFVQPLASLSSRTLWLSVWHADMFGRNDFLGEVTLPLADVVFDDPAPTWHKLHERTEQFDEHCGTRGDLIIGLKFEAAEPRGKGTLHVLVKEAKNLTATKPTGLADVFCKSYLLPERGRLAKQKTGVARRTLSPRWEHTFTYRGLKLQELADRALELSLWDRDRLASNDFMGAIRLSLGSGTYMGANVNWMDSTGKEVTLWQTMMQRPNFWVEGSLPLRPQLNN